MDPAGSDGGGGRAAAGSSLSDPSLASLPAAELVVHLYSGGCRGSDFADAALVLAERERRAADAEARIRAAHETEARLRAEIRALQRRAHDAEARARRLGWSIEIEAGEIDPELAAQDPAAAAAEDDDRTSMEIEADDELGADVDPDDKLTLRQYLKKLKLLRRGGRFAAESGPTRGNNDWEKLRALAIVSSSHDALLAPPPPLVAAPPGNDEDLLPNHDLLRAQKRKMVHQGGAGEDSQLRQNNVQGLSRAMASPVSLASKGSSPPVEATHSEAGGGMKLVDPSNSSMPRRAAGRTRENGLFYRLVFERLRERERSMSILHARAAAPPASQPDIRCWLFAPEPSESVAVEDDPHGKAPQE